MAGAAHRAAFALTQTRITRIVTNLINATDDAFV
jgi:hypothetical protein